ncbi:hypothetical protein NM688_g1024 [Phlebia brevispora]|uniref:Uncharacterized protein n=1 Tax=Phlebia brevispora TaxID=194682 RepID=A0ACC1TCP5_9APHY|nr:hypothetical protein NM688_g1024 [Phlebia brevispora]
MNPSSAPQHDGQRYCQYTRIVPTPYGKAVQIPLRVFLHRVLPPLRHPLDPTLVVQKLLRAGRKASAHRPITLKKRWRGFAQDPAQVECDPEKVFLPFQNAVRAIMRASGSDQTTTSFHHNPACIMDGDSRNDDTLPDAYLTQRSSSRWTKIITFGEFHKENRYEEVEDNVQKVTESMARCMRNDARRRFVYAFTVEDTNMKLWYGDRSQILVSESFNFITDHQPIVHFFLSMVYAQPEEIGLDPTVVLLEDGEHYDITVFSSDAHTRIYRTLDLLSATGLEVLNGRGTRVWRAVALEAGEEVGEHVALKDTWTDPERQMEGDIYERIRAAERQEEYQADIDSRLPTIVYHGDVRSRGDNYKGLDCTPWFSTDAVGDASHPTTSRRELGRERKDHVELFEGVIPERRVHYRIVFKDVCRSLYQETSLASVFHALSQIILALRAMHSSGWVHRDVSPGNILLKADGNAVLVDVELAKPMGNRDERRVGTDDFIAVEVDGQKYLFQSAPTTFSPPILDVPEHDFMDTLIAALGPTDGAFPPGTTVFKISKLFPEESSSLPPGSHGDRPKSNVPLAAQPVKHDEPSPFRYNPLHDLESVWWTVVYFILTKEIFIADDPDSRSSVIASDAQRCNAERLFYDFPSRRDTVRHLGDFARRVQDVSPGMSEIGKILENMRRQLVEVYRIVERNPRALNYDSIRILYEPFSQCFDIIAENKKIQAFKIREFTIIPDSADDLLESERSEATSSTSSCTSGKRSRSDFERHSASPSLSEKDEAQSGRKSKKIKTQHPEEPGQPNGRRRPYLPRRAKTQAGSRR